MHGSKPRGQDIAVVLIGCVLMKLLHGHSNIINTIASTSPHTKQSFSHCEHHGTHPCKSTTPGQVTDMHFIARIGKIGSIIQCHSDSVVHVSICKHNRNTSKPALEQPALHAA